MKTKLIEVVLDREHLVLMTVPEDYGNMVVQYLNGYYGPSAWERYKEVSPEQAAATRGGGLHVVEVDLVGPRTRVFAINAADPEVLAYAMAKYSRSALSMKDSLKEISSQKASEFLNTFYFSYGHKSIADLAHVPMALENISLLAAIEVVDEQRWDGQERSTRYQDFSKRLYYTPEGLDDVETVHYRKSIHALFDAYDETFKLAYEHFKEQNPPGKAPIGVTLAIYERTLRARAFDVARYLLPMATLTSVGQITSARTLEGQISRMMTSPYFEVRELADKLKDAASRPAYNPHGDRNNELMREYYELHPQWSVGGDPVVENLTKIYEAMHHHPAPAPTLVKYTTPNEFQLAVAAYVKEVLQDLRVQRTTRPSPLVSAFGVNDSPEQEIIATLLYEHSNLPYEQVLAEVFRQPSSWRSAFIRDVLKLRGAHDELLRNFRVGGVIFDIYMDIGGMRDMHRHRRCIQIAQTYNADEFAYPEPSLPEVNNLYEATIAKTRDAFDTLRFLNRSRGTGVEAYLLPLGAKRRFLMKMDVAEIAYIAELRTGPAGHISYRRVAWEMYQKLLLTAPNLAEGIKDRVTNPYTPLDFFKR